MLSLALHSRRGRRRCDQRGRQRDRVAAGDLCRASSRSRRSSSSGRCVRDGRSTSCAAASATRGSSRRRAAVVPHGRAAARRDARRHLAGSAQRRDCRRGPPLLPALRDRSDRPRARAVSRRPRQRPAAKAAARSRSSSRARCSSRTSGPRRARRRKPCSRCCSSRSCRRSRSSSCTSNRIYLSGGVYGVETMSRNLFGKPASEPDAARGGADRRPDPRAVRAVAVDQSRGRPRSEPRRSCSGCARRGSSPRRRRRRRCRRVRGSVRIPAPRKREYGYAKEFLRQQFRDRFGGDHPPDWQVRTTFVPELQEAAERAVENGLRRFGKPDLQAALVAIDPATGDVLALVGGRDFRQSQFNRAWRSRRQPGSAFKPFLYAAALSRGYSPVSVLEGLTSIAPQGPEEWAPRNAERRSSGGADAARRAARVEQPRRRAAAAADRIAAGAAPRLRRRLARSARRAVACRSAPASSRRWISTAAYPDVPQRRLRRSSARADACHRRRRRRRLRQPRDRRSRDHAGGGVSDGLDARGRRRPRHGRAGAQHVRRAFSCRGQDRHDRRFQGRLVRRLHVLDRRRASGSARISRRRSDAKATARATRCRSGAISSRPPRESVARTSSVRRTALREEQLCNVSYLKPVEGCPVYTEYFKEGDQIPTRLCPLHQGSVKQQTQARGAGILLRARAEAERHLP